MDIPVLDTIVGLSRPLGLATIAEGVTAAYQIDWLIKNQVSYVQGYYYGQPMPAADFYQWYGIGARSLQENALPVLCLRRVRPIRISRIATVGTVSDSSVA
ncbi:EAL domain-containing protein [Enterobacter cancerogenus]|uniref:EAL domain-containing protein n=1 Tax=Enterobacter cancerogenus TaxID=69218 RepID=UPI00384D39B2